MAIEPAATNRLLRVESTEGEMTSAYQSLHLLQQHRRCLEVEAAFKDGYGLGEEFAAEKRLSSPPKNGTSCD